MFRVGDIVVYKAHRDFGVGIVTWVQYSDMVTYQVDVDWGNGIQRLSSYMIEVIDGSR